MLWTKTLIPTLREIPQEAESVSHQLMLRAGLMRMLVAGVYSYLPLGFKVLRNIENIIREEMNNAGACELLLPALQPQELWDKTGRNKLMEQIMFRFIDRRSRNMCLGPTHEEVITDLVANNVNSYRQLPLILYQIQNKFRDEIRPRNGLIRSCEFIMKDAYSFDADEIGLDKNYELMYEAYVRIFERCGLNCCITEADSGVMGGNVSHEFMVLSDVGEDTVFTCKDCSCASTTKTDACPKCKGSLEEKRAIEVGHIFKLGVKYSESLKAEVLDDKGARRPIIMGCYGIGVSRLIASIIEANHDDKGIIWPKESAPYDCLILPLNITDEATKSCALDLYKKLKEKNADVLLDDRDERSGVKFNDADMIGIPWRIVIGSKGLKKGELEIQSRRDKASRAIGINEPVEKILDILKGRVQ